MKVLKKISDFLQNVTKDSRIPARDKKVLLALVALLISPFDLIPDWIPVVGLLDDFIIICLILDYFFSVLDASILLTHYPWGMKSFSRLRRMAHFFSYFIPGFLKRRMWKYAKLPY